MQDIPKAMTEMIYTDGLNFQALRWNQWTFVFTAKDAWLGSDMTSVKAKES